MKNIFMLTLIFLSSIFRCTRPEKEVYLFSYFKNNGEDGLHLAYSYDGLKWTALNQDRSFLPPQAGTDKLMRDPCLVLDAKGTFHLVWTVSWHEKGIGYAHSTDLMHWSEYLLFLKDETSKPFTPQKNIRSARSDRAEGPFGPASAPVTGDYWAEGPTVIQISDLWHLYFDKYTQHKYGLLVSPDLRTWTDKSDELEYPDGMRHGTVIKIPEKILAKLFTLK